MHAGDSGAAARPRVCLITEGTYPHVLGGVSSWCDQLVRGLDDVDWSIVPITAGGWRRRSLFDIPDHAQLEPSLELWSRTRTPSGLLRRRPDAGVVDLPARLCRDLLWAETDPESLSATLAACHEAGPDAIGAFRTIEAWDRFVRTLVQLSSAQGTDRFTDVEFSAGEAADLWQTLSWVARAACRDLPPSDALIITAAGWPAVLAAVAKQRSGTPVILVEHGVYVREAYLNASRSGVSAGRQLSSTRLATALARLAYHVADKITPVTSAHRPWERYLGAPDARIEPIVNGIDSSRRPTPPRNGRTVVSVGRIDPLKDIVTMLHTARHTIDRMPDVQFRHYGPAAPHNRHYERMCRRVHAALELGDRFVFMGATNDAHGVIRAADLYLSTSISEGLPLSLLEAMTEARPIVSTDVGGCAEVVAGCGMVVNAGDSLALSHAITTILESPDLARMLGRRGHRRVQRRFSIQRQHQRYRELIAAACAGTLTDAASPQRPAPPAATIGSVAS